MPEARAQRVASSERSQPPPLIAARGDEATRAFSHTTDAVELWKALARERPDDRTLGLVSAVVCAFATAIEHIDTEFLNQMGRLRRGATRAHADRAEAARVRAAPEQRALQALGLARASWEAAHEAKPRDMLVAAAASAASRLLEAATVWDVVVFRDIWNWGFAGPPIACPRSVTGGRSQCDRSVEALEALSRAAELFRGEAQRQPSNPLAVLNAELLESVERAIAGRYRLRLAALRGALLDAPPASEQLRIRGLPADMGHWDDPPANEAVRVSFAAADECERAASFPWANPATRMAASGIAALLVAIGRNDLKALGELDAWAQRYTENKRMVPTHARSVRADELVRRLVAELGERRGRGPGEGEWPRARWLAFVAAALDHIMTALPECVSARGPSDAALEMSMRLGSWREQRRLLDILARTPPYRGDSSEQAFARAFVVSALKANDHTAGFADNLFAHHRMSRHRKGA